MIARLWAGRVPAGRAEEYAEYQREVGPPRYRLIDGNRGVLMLGRSCGHQYEIAMFTIWESWEAIRAFAGDPPSRARYYSRDLEFLVDPPDEVEHFDVVAREGLRPGANVARLWRGRVDPSRVEEAVELERELATEQYQQSAGSRGLCLLRGAGGEAAILSLWASSNAVLQFAGVPPDFANYDEYRRRGYDYLVDAPDRVGNFEILEAKDLEDARGRMRR